MQQSDTKAAIQEAAACYQSGNLARAEQIYRAIVSAAPASLHYADLGIILEAQGKHEEAAAAYSEAIRLGPREARPHYNLGNLLWGRGRADEAAASFQRAVALKPDFADAHNNLGRLLVEKGQVEESVPHFRKAVAADPGLYFAHNNLGTALHHLGRFKKAMQCYRHALKLKPDYAEAFTNLGSAHLRLGQFEEAITHCLKAVTLNPGFPDGHYNLANAYRSALRLDEAIHHYERAIALRPDAPGYRWNYSVALLLNGDYARGWKEYEWRWQGCLELKHGKPAFRQPEWTGQDISGKTLLLYREQGMGDVIQFVRYAPMAAARGASVVVACQPELVRLVGTVDGISKAVSIEQALPPFDFHCPLLSLPLIFNTTLETIPSNVPYIHADPALVEVWRRRIGVQEGLKVGLIWGGWASNSVDHMRSVPLGDFAQLARIRGFRFYSLQKGEHAAQTRSAPAGLPLIDWTGDIHDFADTAALMANLDLLISVDTAGLHLAGALGKPAWLLCRHESEWRWLLERDDSPWYPTLRIFRQSRPGRWQDVMEKAATALKELVRKTRAGPD